MFNTKLSERNERNTKKKTSEMFIYRTFYSSRGMEEFEVHSNGISVEAVEWYEQLFQISSISNSTV